MLKPVQASTYTFRKIIDGGFLYVDKTEYLYKLVRPASGVYFLARPRRFGKSLMISTLEEIFLGNRALFQGLWIDASDYNWQTYPVIRIDFSRMQVASDAELRAGIERYLRQIARQYQVAIGDGPYYALFEDLILALAEQGPVVILIDEYDKPLIDALTNVPEAQKIRETLRGFYTLIKAMDQYLRFVFITGISKFSKVGVFSAMNNLDDLTMDGRFATALGITETELEEYFAGHIAAFAEQNGSDLVTLRQRIRNWYDGFCFFEGCESVYNPFSTLQLFNKLRFANYWFETGTPTFLIKLLKEQQYDIEQLDDLRLRELAFNTYEIETLSIIPLLFQTGYLTIKDYEPARRIYTLAYPNMEVEDAFLTYLLGEFSKRDRGLNEAQLWRMIDALEAHDLDRFFGLLQVFFANVPYQIHLKYEKYYQTIFYLIFKLIGLRIDAEVETNVGRIDAVVEVADHIFLFEFKLDKSAE
ncbi:MAG: AAA family ATPase [Caldilineaceae bacterium]